MTMQGAAVEAASDAEGFRLSPQQSRLCSLAHSDGDALYRTFLLARVPVELDRDRLARALAKLVEETEILRTVYRSVAGMGEKLQFILPASDVAVTVGQYEDGCTGACLDLGRGPVLNLELRRESTGSSIVALTISAVAADRRASVVLLERLLASYENPEASQFPALQYADAAEWMAQAAEDPEAGPALTFWRQCTRDLAISTRSRDAGSFQPARYRFRLDPDCIQSRERTLAAWQSLLSRHRDYAGSQVAVWSDGRDHELMLDAIGVFGRYLPGIAYPGGSDALDEITDNVSGQLRTAESLLRYAPQIELPYGFDYASCDSGRFEILDSWSYGERFEVLLTCGSSGDCSLFFDAARLSQHEAASLADGLGTLLAHSAKDPRSPATALPLLSGKALERAQRLSKGPELATAPSSSILDLICHNVVMTPGHVAITSAGETLTYAQLWTNSGRMAAWLAANGGGPETLTAIALPNGASILTAIVAVLRAGGAYVPIDADYPTERIRYLLEDSRAGFILTDSVYLSRVPKSDVVTLCLDLPFEAGDFIERPAPDPSSLAYVIYTSGSTGRPKGVSVAHSNLLSSTTARLRSYPEPVSNYLLLSSFSFDSSVAGIFWTLAQGGTLTVPEPGAVKDTEFLQYLIASRGITHLLSLPSLYQVLLECGADRLRALRAVIVAGEICRQDLVRRHRELLPDCSLYNEYGPTEGTVWSSVWQDDRQTGPVPIGRPIHGASVYVLDAYQQFCPMGIVGEIYVGGRGVARGYLRRPAETAARFVPDPFAAEPGARMYRTGDRGRWRDDGQLEFLGRLDEQVKIRGYRIETGEIEAVLRAHAGVLDAAVLVREDRPGAPRLVAYIVPGRAKPDRAELMQYLAAALPQWMLPSELVSLQSFPRNPNGKIDRNAFPSPEEGPGSTAVARQARTPVEAELIRIWQRVLRRDDFGVDDHFLRLGGDSLLGIQVVARARDAGIRITSRLLFEFPTIAELAQHAETQQFGAAVAAAPALTTGPLPPIYRWFFDRNLAHPEHYNQALLLDALRPLEMDLLEQAFDAVIARHDSLRLRVRRDGADRHLMLSQSSEHDALTFFDLELLPAETMGGLMNGLNERLDLEQGPLMRAAYLQLASGDQLYWVIHHLAVDGVSWRILIEDLERAYLALEAGHKPQLERAGTEFLEWSSRVRDLASSDLDSARDYWRKILTPSCGRLPRDRHEGINVESNLEVWTDELDSASTQKLLRGVPANLDGTVHEVLVAALGLAAAEWGSTDRIRIDWEHHGRDERVVATALDRTTGWFTAICPAVICFPPHLTVEAAMREAVVQLRPLRDKGFFYGVLRHAHPRLEDEGTSDILFNYLGQVDALLADCTLFRLASTSAGATRHPDNARSHAIEIDTDVRSGRLQFEWRYARTLHDESTIRTRAQRTIAILTQLCSTFREGDAQ